MMLHGVNDTSKYDECFFFCSIVLTPGDGFTVTGGKAGDGESSHAGDWPLDRYPTTSMPKQARICCTPRCCRVGYGMLQQDTVR